MNYLELVNTAMDEAGIDLDHLTSATFANPAERMQVKFKRWVADAWKGIQLSRSSWSFMSGRAFGRIHPRIYIQQGTLTTAPVPGDLYEGASNGSLFTVTRVTTTSGDWGLGTAYAFVDMANLTGDTELGEAFNRISGTRVNNAFFHRGRGRYDFTQIVSDFDDVDYESVFLSDTSAAGINNKWRIKFVGWNQWKNFQEGVINNQSKPVIFTQPGDGLFDFFPSPNKEYSLYFNYSRKAQPLVVADDVPVLDEDFHALIYWKAVEAYGRYDEKPSIVRQAQAEGRAYTTLMERKFLPLVGWAPGVFG